ETSYHSNSSTILAELLVNFTGTSSSALPFDSRMVGEPSVWMRIFHSPLTRNQPSPFGSILLPTAARKYMFGVGVGDDSVSVRFNSGIFVLLAAFTPVEKSSMCTGP